MATSSTTLEDIVTSLPPVPNAKALAAAAAQQLGVPTPPLDTKRTCQTSTTADAVPPSSPFVDELKSTVEAYQTKRYGSGKVVTARFALQNDTDNADNGGLVLRTYAQMDHGPKGPTTVGYWAATWHINAAHDTISGTIHVHVSNTEDGTLHIRATRTVPAQTVESAAAADVFKVISRAESELLADLTDADAATTALKRVRRILPITKTRMKWDGDAHKGIHMLNKKNG